MHAPGLSLPVTSLYAGGLGVMFGGLSLLVVFRRRSLMRGMGDGGDAVIAKRIRAHSNFAEYVPFSLMLLAVLELGHVVPNLALHGLGAALVAGRIMHAAAFLLGERNPLASRKFGTIFTIMPMVVSSVLCFLRGAGVLQGGSSPAVPL